MILHLHELIALAFCVIGITVSLYYLLEFDKEED